jgi:hypothetical protein
VAVAPVDLWALIFVRVPSWVYRLSVVDRDGLIKNPPALHCFADLRTNRELIRARWQGLTLVAIPAQFELTLPLSAQLM